MLFSPDFLRYFEAMAVLLERDRTLFCVSAWNDNGREEHFDWDHKRMVSETPSTCIHACPPYPTCSSGLICAV